MALNTDGNKLDQFASTNRQIELAKSAAMLFLDADLNGDHELSFEEFLLCVPEHLTRTLTQEQIRSVFDAADADKDGNLSVSEFFLWTFDVMSTQNGTGLEGLFRKYDRSGEGSLDASEFKLALDEMGFGLFAHELFMELDDDESGLISYSEMQRKLASDLRTPLTHNCKLLMAGLAIHAEDMSRGEVSESMRNLSLSRWCIDGTTVEQVRQQLSAHLLKNAMRVSDLHYVLTRDCQQVSKRGRKKLTYEDFPAAMRSLGFCVEGEEGETLLKLVFERIDIDKSGGITLTEMHKWMSGSLEKRARALEVRLLDNRDDGITLFDIDWTPEQLRTEVQAMLILHDLAPMDLLFAYDGSEDNVFAWAEFLRMMKKLVSPGQGETLDLWDMVIRPCVQEAFTLISGTDHKLDAIELERWLNRNWRENSRKALRYRDYMRVVNSTHAGMGGVGLFAAARSGRDWHAFARDNADARHQKEQVKMAMEMQHGFLESPTRSTTSHSKEALRMPLSPKMRARSAGRQRSTHDPEVHVYLAEVCSLAQVQRPARDQWALLADAERELRRRQDPDHVLTEQAAFYNHYGWPENKAGGGAVKPPARVLRLGLGNKKKDTKQRVY